MFRTRVRYSIISPIVNTSSKRTHDAQRSWLKEPQIIINKTSNKFLKERRRTRLCMSFNLFHKNTMFLPAFFAQNISMNGTLTICLLGILFVWCKYNSYLSKHFTGHSLLFYSYQDNKSTKRLQAN